MGKNITIREGVSMQKGIILSLIFTAIVVVFALSNSGVVSIDLMFASFEVSQAIVIFMSAILGGLVVSVLSFFRRIKLSREIKSLKSELDGVKEERKSLIDQLESKDKQIMSLYDINTNVRNVQNQDE